MDEKTCLAHRENINRRLDNHDKRLENHGKRIGELEKVVEKEEFYDETLEDHEQRIIKIEHNDVRVEATLKSIDRHLTTIQGWGKWLVIVIASYFIKFILDLIIIKN